jgi:hypothetical protein
LPKILELQTELNQRSESAYIFSWTDKTEQNEWKVVKFSRFGFVGFESELD